MRISDWSSDLCSSDLQWSVSLLTFTRLSSMAVRHSPFFPFPTFHPYGSFYRLHPTERTNRWTSPTSPPPPAITGPPPSSASFLRSEEHKSELQSLIRIPIAVFCLKKKKLYNTHQ